MSGTDKSKEAKRRSSASTSKRKSASKRRKVQRRFEVDSEDERVKQRLNAKFSNKHRKLPQDSHTCCMRRTDDGAFKVHNGERHDTIVRRAESARLGHSHKTSEREDCVATRWKCALCQQRCSRSILGDLFGPYFISASAKHWPSFLAKKPAQLKADSVHVFDVWLHGMCALTAPGIEMRGNQLPGLETVIVSYWNQHCAVCSKEGATLEVKGKLMHFPCALGKGYKHDVPLEQISQEPEEN